MKSKTANQSVVGKLDTVLLEHIARYRLTVVDAVVRLPQLADCQQEQIERGLQALKHRSLLSSAPLCVGSIYWHLTAKGAAKCALPERQSGPLSESAKL